MDPQACLNEILTLIGTDDQDRLNELCESLYQWLRRGGFAPTFSRQQRDFIKINSRFALMTKHVTDLSSPWMFVSKCHGAVPTERFQLAAPEEMAARN